MGRGLLISLCLLAVAWFEFRIYPGHSYLQAETQLLVPMLERLDTPGFLSRDLVATNPTFAYTIYDEITQALHADAHLSFEQALLRQQFFFRFVALLGVFLLARQLQVAPFGAIVLSAEVNAITHLASPDAFVTNPEATPVAFAFSLVLLAAGCLVHRKPLLASLAAGFALLYDPLSAATFWIVLLISCLAVPSLRKPMRPVWPVLAVFALILGNLVQLQPGLGSGPELTGRLTPALIDLTRLRLPWLWTSTWISTEIWSYLFLLVAAVWALVRLAPFSDRLTNWVIAGLALAGVASLFASLLLEAAHSQIATAMPPARNLALTVALAGLLVGAASFHAVQSAKWIAAVAFATLLFAMLLNPQVLDLLHGQFAAREPSPPPAATVRTLAAWADQNTWGSSMFQFPDSAHELAPGIFRALSRRALYADWNSGLIAASSDPAGQEWWSRWQNTMAEPYTPTRLKTMLPLPIDYYVLHRIHQLPHLTPAYANSDYVVYDAQDLRQATRLK